MGFPVKVRYQRIYGPRQVRVSKGHPCCAWCLGKQYGFLGQRVMLGRGEHRRRKAVGHHEPWAGESKGRSQAFKHSPDGFSLRLGRAGWPAMGTMPKEPSSVLAERPSLEGAVVEFVKPLI